MRTVKKQERIAILEELVALWEGSVKATHLFLNEDEVEKIKVYVPTAIKEISILVVEEDEEGIVGFMGIEDRMLAMLFVKQEKRGTRIGKRLLQLGIQQYHVHEVNVNEQNPQAIGFYEAMGFVAYRKTPYDEQGNPYPIVYMKR